MRPTTTHLKRAGGLLAIVAVLGLVTKFLLLYLTDAIFAPPVIFLSDQLGPVMASAVLVPVYAWASYRLAMLTVAGIDHRRDGRLSAWLVGIVSRERDDDVGRTVRSWWNHGPVWRFGGLVISGALLGGIVTTGLWRFRRPRDPLERIRKVAWLTSAAFAAGFVPLYAILGPEALDALTGWL